MSFRSKACNHVSKVNPYIAEGIATIELANMVKLVESTYRAALNDPNGLELDYIRHCDPRTEFEKDVFKRNGAAPAIEMAVSDMRLMEISIKHRGEPLQKKFYIKLLFCRANNFIMISGKMSQLLSQLSDRCITAVKNQIYVQFVRAKFVVFELAQTINIGGKAIAQAIPHAKIHNEPANNKKAVSTSNRSKAKPLLFLNLLAKYGLEEAFRISCGVIPIFLSTESESDNEKRLKLLDSGYVVISSTGKRPGKIPKESWGIPKIYAMVHEDDISIELSICMASFFYLVERHPSNTDTLAKIYSQNIWLVIMGLINMGTNSYATLLAQMSNHIESVSRYFDEPSRKMFADIGIHVNDTFELLKIIMLNAHTWLSISNATMNDVTFKQISVLQKIASSVTSSIFHLNFRYHQMVTKRTEPLSNSDAEKLCNDYIKRGTAYDANKSKLVRNASIVGDRKLPRLCTVVDPTNRGGSEKNIVFSPADAVHSSLLWCMQVNHHPDSSPFGRGALNPFTGDGNNLLAPPSDPTEFELYVETNKLLATKL